MNAFGGPCSSPYAVDLYTETCHLIKLAVNTKKILPAYDDISFDRKRRAEGSARHHEIYDISDDARHLLLCVRETEGSKYGVSTTSKEYFIISTHGKGVRVQDAPKAKAAKAAKQAVNPGDAITVCLGKKKLQGTVSSMCRETCYKIVAVADDFVSVFDNSPWTLGKSRREASTKNHDGGFYVFPTVEAALIAWTERKAFADEWMTAEKYSLLECECSGRRYLHDNKKICVTQVKPVAEVAGLLI
jgi:TusA-related sulfurtransferase